MNIYNFYSSDLEIVLSIILFIIISFMIYNKFNLGKLYLNIFKMKVNIISKNTNWGESNNTLDENTKHIELDFILQINNNKNTNNNIYDLDLFRKIKGKYHNLENHHLNLADSMKSLSGASTYEKIKYVNLLPYEIKELHLKIKLEKEEYKNLKKYPIYIKYKTKRKKKQLKLNKYLNLK